jgi:hypothetical protein
VKRKGQRISAAARRKILPSSEADGLASGVADVAFIGNTMYAIFAGAGCSHGVPSIPNAVIRVNPDHSWTIIADLGAFQRTHPVANPTDPITGDFEPDGTWYSMIAVRGDLHAVEPIIIMANWTRSPRTARSRG